MGFWSRLLRTDAESPGKPQVPYTQPLAQAGGVGRFDDGLMNALTGLGQHKRDSRTAADWRFEPLTQEQLEAMYRMSDTAATIVDEPVNEMFRRGFDLLVGEGDESQQVGQDTFARLDETDFLERLAEGMRWARAYGGAVNFIGADDGQEPDQPLAEDRIRKFDSLTTLTPREIRPVVFESDLKSPRYGQPVLYEIKPEPLPQSLSTAASASVAKAIALQATRIEAGAQPVLVHHTRLIRFDGISVSRRQTFNNPSGYGWGDSVLQRPRWLIRDFDTAWQAAARILMTFSMPKYKMKGLAEILEKEDSSRAMWRRIQAITQSMVATGIVVMDSEEDVELDSQSVAGLAEMLQQHAVRLSAAARMPVTILMGQSPAGLNATGASDIRNWYAKVAAEQARTLDPALKRVLQLMFLSADGPTSGKEPADWRIKQRPLWEMTEDESAGIRLKQAQVDQIYINTQVLSPEEVGVSAFGGPEYSTNRSIDVEARKTEGGAPPVPDPQGEKDAQAKLELEKAKAAGATPPIQKPASA
jgi:phage-related protein (TIGR01555 family)